MVVGRSRQRDRPTISGQPQSFPSTTAVPVLPGLGPYPGLTFTITIAGFVPLIVLPDFVTRPVTSTAVYAGTVPAGGGLLPPLVDQFGAPQAVGPAGLFAKPLKALGATPPDTELDRCH